MTAATAAALVAELRDTTHWLLLLYSVAKVSCLLLSLHTFWVVLSVCLDYYILLLLWHHTGLFCHPASPIALLWSKVEEKQLLKKLLPPSPWKTSSSATGKKGKRWWSWYRKRRSANTFRSSPVRNVHHERPETRANDLLSNHLCGQQTDYGHYWTQ